MDGVLVIDKPPGPTSHDVVSRVRRATGIRRVGHTGTLDPLASGVLTLVLGRAARLAQFLSGVEKEYHAQIRLGLDTNTYDVTGEPVAPAAAPRGDTPDRQEIEQTLREFLGAYLQKPPPFSAKKIAGTRAYALARRGTPVQPKPSPVLVSRLDLVACDGDVLELSMTCSAGFYVRSLAHDLGVHLGTGGCLQALRRVRTGDYRIDQSLPIELVERDPVAARARIIPLSALLTGLPGLRLTGDGVRRAARGNLIGPLHLLDPPGAAASRVRLLDGEGHLVAIAEPAGEPGFLHPGIVVM
jgi:tRNA pseudouridine55 synthase